MAVHDALTRREWEVYALLFQGKTYKEIAAILVVAEGTVEGHVRSILRKLSLKTRPQAQYYAACHGLFIEELRDIPAMKAETLEL
jgi:DNA-binding NarL/FixJ family response regulator